MQYSDCFNQFKLFFVIITWPLKWVTRLWPEKYWVIQKKLFTWRFQHNQDYLGWNNFCNRKYWQSTIFMQVLNIFGDGQNCKKQTFKWLYQLNESKYEKSFFGKILTVMLFHMYQVSSSLLGHLHFSLHFFSTFMEQLFLNHPISTQWVPMKIAW